MSCFCMRGRIDQEPASSRIQSSLYRGLTEACGASYYTLFFIRTNGHGDYPNRGNSAVLSCWTWPVPSRVCPVVGDWIFRLGARTFKCLQ
jgi:hypothetical protein